MWYTSIGYKYLYNKYVKYVLHLLPSDARKQQYRLTQNSQWRSSNVICFNANGKPVSTLKSRDWHRGTRSNRGVTIHSSLVEILPVLQLTSQKCHRGLVMVERSLLWQPGSGRLDRVQKLLSLWTPIWRRNYGLVRSCHCTFSFRRDLKTEMFIRAYH